jgi:hypothetical protein
MSAVLKRFGHVLLIVALLCATGTHWIMLQSVAWATMLVDNAQSGDLGTAITKTFDGKHPCALCKVVTQGKQSEKKSDAHLGVQKLEFYDQTAALILDPPTKFQWLTSRDCIELAVSDAPPVPPPRLLPG